MSTSTMSQGGRVVVPAEIRKLLGLKEGDTVLWEVRDGEARLTTRRAQLERARRLAEPYLKGWTVDDFIAERRVEAEEE